MMDWKYGQSMFIFQRLTMNIWAVHVYLLKMDNGLKTWAVNVYLSQIDNGMKIWAVNVHLLKIDNPNGGIRKLCIQVSNKHIYHLYVWLVQQNIIYPCKLFINVSSCYLLVLRLCVGMGFPTAVKLWSWWATRLFLILFMGNV